MTQKIKTPATLRQAADILRELALALEQGKNLEVLGLSLDLANHKNIRVGLKLDGDGYKMKIAVKQAGDSEKDDYSGLKKRMKGAFKAMRSRLASGNMPQLDIIKGFIEDSRRMVEFPGKGDEYYQAHNQAMELFCKAFEAHDIAAMAEACKELDRVKSDCHDKYK